MSSSNEIILEGIGVSEGIAVGPVVLFKTDIQKIEKETIYPEQVKGEIYRLKKAIESVKEDLNERKEILEAQLGREHSFIFDIHIHILNDELIVNTAEELISEDLVTAEYAIYTVMNKFTELLEGISDEFIKDKQHDVKSVLSQVLNELLGIYSPATLETVEPCVLMAHDLSPTETAVMRRDIVLGFVTEVGSKTSHTAIMARALEIPAVVGVGRLPARLRAGDNVIVDGASGKVIIKPAQQSLNQYQEKLRIYIEKRSKARELKDLRPITTDGYYIELAANLELIDGIPTAKDYGAKSVGLFRSEYLYLNKGAPPGEEEQFQVYKTLAEGFPDGKVIIRTVDIGGDKFISAMKLSPELISSLGLRAIRLCLRHPEIFQPQLKAILRASHYGNVHIMFPMISNTAELIQARDAVKKAMDSLYKQDIPFDHHIRIGIMIEVPSAAILAPVLAQHCDFFSIGTNDLIQYLFAVDRVNDAVAYLYDPLHPAVLNAIDTVIKAAHDHGIWVGLCGEMAGETAYTPILVGLGIDKLSMNPVALPQVKKMVRSIEYAKVRELSKRLLKQKTAEEIETVLMTEFYAHHSLPRRY